MSYRIADFGPSDLLTSPVEDSRRVKVSINEQVIGGNKAITVQSFAEKNSKDGTQYEAAFFEPDLDSGASVDIVLVVGDNPILMKDISIQFNVEDISSQWFRNPVYTGGTEMQVYNFNDEQAVPDDVTILAGPTVTDTGTAVGPLIHSLGEEKRGNFRASNVSQGVGFERVLWSNSTYLFRLTNESDISAKVAGFATWFQGVLSTQTPLDI